MPLQIETRREQGCLVIVIRGSFGAAEDAKQVRVAVDEALARGQILILVNLEEVQKLDNFGVQTVLACSFITAHRGGLLEVYGVPAGPARQDFGLETGLFIEASSEEDAMNRMLDRASREGIQSKPFDILEFVREEEKRSDESGPGTEPKLATS